MKAFVTALALASIAVAGCGNDSDVTTTNTIDKVSSATASSDPHALFDPCKDIDPGFIATEQLDAIAPRPSKDTAGDIRWEGCGFIAKSGYALSVQTSTGTVDQARERGFRNYRDTTVAGRRAGLYEGTQEAPNGCTVNVEMKGGSLELLVDDPKTENQHHLSECDLVTYLAEKIVPMLPANS